jgi:hypothetical protein
MGFTQPPAAGAGAGAGAAAQAPPAAGADAGGAGAGAGAAGAGAGAGAAGAGAGAGAGAAGAGAGAGGAGAGAGAAASAAAYQQRRAADEAARAEHGPLWREIQAERRRHEWLSIHGTAEERRRALRHLRGGRVANLATYENVLSD